MVCLARETGLINSGTIAVNGAKVKTISQGQIRKVKDELKAQVDAPLQRAPQVDEAEKNERELTTPA